MVKKAFIFLLRIYQRWLSPLKVPTCRFVPTCSSYAIEALESFGLIKGLGLTVIRLLKCQPFHPGGYDPVRPAEDN
jgi:hypothetical protein